MFSASRAPNLKSHNPTPLNPRPKPHNPSAPNPKPHDKPCRSRSTIYNPSPQRARITSHKFPPNILPISTRRPTQGGPNRAPVPKKGKPPTPNPPPTEKKKKTRRGARFSTISSKEPSAWFLVLPFRNLGRKTGLL